MQILTILFFVLVAFIGYLIGRFGHYYFGGWHAPHHWIYGLLLIILGWIYYPSFIGLLMLSFGIGHFISDLKDFWQMEFFGPDEGERRFWGID